MGIIIKLDTVPKVVTEMLRLELGLGLRSKIGFRVRVRVSVRVNSFRGSFSVLLRVQHYSMLTTFGSTTTAIYYCGVELIVQIEARNIYINTMLSSSLCSAHGSS